MLKNILFIFILLLAALTQNSYAQKGFYAGFSGNLGTTYVVNHNLYGIKWGHLNKDKTFDPAHKTAIGYGGTAKVGYNFIPPLGIQGEVGYQARGEKYEDTDGSDFTHHKDIELNYITVGVYLRYTSIFKKNFYKKEQKVRLALTIGPQINVLFSAKQEYSVTGEAIDLLNLNFENIDYPSNNSPAWTSDYSFTTEQNDKALFKNYDIGLLSRIGVDIYPKPWFFISPTLTSYFGITDVNDKKYTEHSGYGQSRNFAIGVELGFGFYVNK